MTHPVFILAPPRSFTSVVCGMIGQHPQLYGLPEVNLFAGATLADLGRWHGARPRLRHGLLRAVAELGLKGQEPADIDAAESWLTENASQPTATIWADLAAWAGPRGLVDKSPIYVLEEGALDRIWNGVPGARFIHMTRHPAGTCRSMQGLRDYIAKAGGRVAGAARGKGAAIDPGKFWLEPHLRAKEFLDSLPADRWLRLRGEDLMEAPDTYLPQIAEWLGLRTDAEAIAAMKQPEASAFARMGPANARFGNDPGFMESPALRPYHARAESLDDPLPEGVTGGWSDTLRHYARLFGYR
jgi:hypothetical protein